MAWRIKIACRWSSRLDDWIALITPKSTYRVLIQIRKTDPQKRSGGRGSTEDKSRLHQNLFSFRFLLCPFLEMIALIIKAWSSLTLTFS